MSGTEQGQWHFLDKRSKALARNKDGLLLEFHFHMFAELGLAVLNRLEAAAIAQDALLAASVQADVTALLRQVVGVESTQMYRIHPVYPVKTHPLTESCEFCAVLEPAAGSQPSVTEPHTEPVGT